MTTPEVFYKITNQPDDTWTLHGSYRAHGATERAFYLIASFGNKYDAREGLIRHLSPVEELYDEKGNPI